MTTVSLVMDLPPDASSAVLSVDALGHAIAAVDPTVALRLVRTPDLDPETDLGHGVVIGPGSPYERPDAAEEAIQTARERGVPLVGT